MKIIFSLIFTALFSFVDAIVGRWVFGDLFPQFSYWDWFFLCIFVSFCAGSAIVIHQALED